MRMTCKCLRCFGIANLLILTAFTPSSCAPRFKYPLPAPENLKPDREISGQWFRKTENDKQQLSVFPRKDGWIDIVYVYDIDSKTSIDGINVLIFEGYTTSLAKRKFLSLRLRKKDVRLLKEGGEDWRAFLIVNYDVSAGGDLIVKNLSIDKLAELIKAGRLKGEVAADEFSKDGYNDGVAISSSSEELLKVMQQEGPDSLLENAESQTMVFYRAKTGGRKK